MSTGKENCIFFSAPIKGEREKVKNMVIKLGNWIESKGFIIINKHVVSENPAESFSKQIGKPSKDITPEDIERQDLLWILEAKYLIAEVSAASTGVGREIEYARNFAFKMKILCLCLADCKKTASPMIIGMTPDRYSNVTVAYYKDIEEAKHIIKDFLGIKI